MSKRKSKTAVIEAAPGALAEPQEKRILAWHFINSDMTTQHDDSIVVKPGETLSVTGDIRACSNGLHGSIRLWDAFSGYANGRTMLCRVEIWGDVDEQPDKIAGRYRKCLWAIDIERLLHEFACQAAEMALLAERAAGREPDARCWFAVETKRKWLAGTATDDELNEAREAARAVAYSAAYSAADVAAYAAAREAAYAAAYSAAHAAHAAAYAAYAALNELFEKLVLDYYKATRVVG